MGDIEAAIAAIESLKLGEKPNYTQIAKKYGVERSTLSRRARKVTRSITEKYDEHRLLNTRQETELIQYIKTLCTRGLPPSRQMLRSFASEIAGNPAGNHWPDRFIERHKLDLVSRWTTGIDSSRKKADVAGKYSLYFQLLNTKIEQYDIQPCHMYNMDEKGFLIGVLSRMKRIFSRAHYDKGKLKAMLQDGNREWITTIACICADGSSLTPALIYQAASGNLQDTWLQDFDPTIHKAFFTSSPSGWTNHDIGLSWLKQVFDRETKAKARRSYRLLVLDGHGSHLTMEFIKYCDDNRILLAIYPPHSTHTLQPLDVSMFKPLSSAYTAELARFMENCQGLSAITKRDFFRLFYKAWSVAFKKATILRSFEATGLSPFNPTAILKRFDIEGDDRPSSSSSSSSVLSASDWRKIERLLKQAVEDIHDVRAHKLSQTIHSISIQKQLLQHECSQLKEALVNEKKRRQRSKPLLLEVPPEYHGGAVFWSPNKVQQARDRQVQKEANEKETQQQKVIQNSLKQQQKAEKATMLEERRRLRATAQEARKLEQARKAIEREESETARKLKKQLQEDLKLAKRGNQKGLKQNIEPSHESETIIEDILLGFDEEVAAGPSTRTRQVQLPQRYRK